VKSRREAVARGLLRVELVDPDGTRHLVGETENLITELGDALVASRMSDASIAAISHMAIGSGSGQTATSTTLATETARVALTSTTRGTSGDDNLVTYVATFGAGVGTGTISEAGLFNASSSGTMFNYSSGFSSFSKGADQSVDFTWTVRYGAST